MRSREQSVNVRAAFAHVLADALGSLGAIAAGISVVLFRWNQADAVFSIVIAVLVATSGWRVLKETTSILLERVPAHLDPAAIARTITETDGVARCADLHVWSISDEVDAVIAHVVLQPEFHGVDVAGRVANRVRAEHAVALVTIQPMAAAPQSLVPLRRSQDGQELLSAPRRPKPPS
jgi:cobalt-zinc-cadmium efflux system protein